MQHAISKLGTPFFIIYISLCLSNCTSSYLSTREKFINERLYTNETGKTRAELEKRWGDPVTTVINPDRTVTCTYEYKVMADADLKPWALTGDAFSFFLKETIPFPYYVVKDLFIRDCFQAKVTYNQQDVAFIESHYPIECNPLIFIK